MKLTITGRDGASQTVEAAFGRSVMEAIRDAGFEELLALCGGSCACGTCHVYVEHPEIAQLPPMGPVENDLLEISPDRNALSRLSCQIRIDGKIESMSVRIAPEPEE